MPIPVCTTAYGGSIDAEDLSGLAQPLSLSFGGAALVATHSLSLSLSLSLFSIDAISQSHSVRDVTDIGSFLF